ncbi:transposase unknown protein [Crocosphaera watsonii WH 8501]|uniref:Transposase n=1 Tax=Crocosphaera watsonii WH 8501 TaxID=165597 RepID=Q4C5J9_CROWT|nr:hypothetical protein CwatDRAFT_2659 [Crocosphaera watsonii WH 8501]EAM51389.1 hypothetical protein CwatDRAFT_4514 [Crocosphaera watsonii WH 8501]EAM52702.1 transposase unknown protein [Crocosphaera watsonii WH 8501]
MCLGLQSVNSGCKKWEERYPIVAQSLKEIAEAHAQQNPTFNNPIAYTRLTAAEAIKQLRNLGYNGEEVPAASTMADILNRLGYRLRKVVKAKPKKKSRRRTLSSRI